MRGLAGTGSYTTFGVANKQNLQKKTKSQQKEKKEEPYLRHHPGKRFFFFFLFRNVISRKEKDEQQSGEHTQSDLSARKKDRKQACQVYSMIIYIKKKEIQSFFSLFF